MTYASHSIDAASNLLPLSHYPQKIFILTKKLLQIPNHLDILIEIICISLSKQRFKMSFQSFFYQKRMPHPQDKIKRGIQK